MFHPNQIVSPTVHHSLLAKDERTQLSRTAKIRVRRKGAPIETCFSELASPCTNILRRSSEAVLSAYLPLPSPDKVVSEPISEAYLMVSLQKSMSPAPDCMWEPIDIPYLEYVPGEI